MVIHINLGGRLNEFDEKTLNVKHVFGPYAVLLDKYLKPVPLKPSGEPLELLKDNETFTVQISGLGPQGSSLIEKTKKQQLQRDKEIQSSKERQVISLTPQPPKLIVTDKARKRIVKRERKTKHITEDQDCECDCGCFEWFSKSKSTSKNKNNKHNYNWTSLTEVQVDTYSPAHDRSAKELERMINAALN